MADVAGSPIRSIAPSFLIVACSALPPFLVGTNAYHIRSEFGLSSDQLGLLLSTSFVVTAVVSHRGGRAVDRMGARRATVGVAILSLSVMLTVGLLARSVVILGGAMVLSGLVNALALPTANLILHERLSSHRQGLAFGFAQASIPVSGMLAGLAVPAFAETMGWRWSFVVVAAAPLMLIAVRPRDVPGGLSVPPVVADADDEETSAGRRATVLLGLVAGIGASIILVLSTFFVLSAVETGFSPSIGGVLVSAGSALGVGVRVIAGWRIDRLAQGFPVGSIQALFLLAAGGSLLLSTTMPWAIVVGALAAFAGGWGWSGVLQLAVVRLRPHDPGAATGTVLVGMASGSAVGPVLFGWLSRLTSMRIAWAATAGLAVIAALVVRHVSTILQSSPPGTTLTPMSEVRTVGLGSGASARTTSPTDSHGA